MTEIKKDFKIGDIVYNPDVAENSPNYIGKIIMVVGGATVDGEYKRYAKVKFRDYNQFFSLDILVPALND